ncbi:Protein TALPID3 [Channa argus]|uniref:Protein TALPID3 n=1 Tax=Channa argus TaxID=215402 RepID=A0A6G1QF03_CHAAH|nr:Protein TALPID3 [Channa argus]
MFPQPDSSSHTLGDWSDKIGPDQSSCSSDTGDVLIRSTKVPLPDQRHAAGPGHGSVQITVRKMRDPPPVQRLSCGTEKQHQRAKPRQRSDPDPPPRSAAERQAGIRQVLLKNPVATKENRKPRGSPPAAELSPDRTLPPGAQSDRQPGTDLLTSCFTAGGRGVVLAALKQRSHSAPRKREIKVQLLDPEVHQPSSQDGEGPRLSSQDTVGEASVQMEPGLSSAHFGDTTNAAAAAAAAAVVTAAPLIKAQSDMEARVSQLADGVQKLLQADREGKHRGQSLSQQTLQHMETLYGHQLQLQTQLLESVLRIVTVNGPATNTTSYPTASARPACLQITHLDAAANVLNNDQQSSSATRVASASAAAAAAAMETGPAAMATPSSDRWPEQTRDKVTHLHSSANYSQEPVRRTNEVLREMGRLKSEMKMLLMPEDSLRTTSPPPDHMQSHQNQTQQTKSQRSKSQQHYAHPSKKVQSHQSHSHQSQSHSQQSQSQLIKSQQHYSHQNQPLSQNVKSNQSPFQQFQSHQNHSQQSQPQSQIHSYQTVFQDKQNPTHQTPSHSQQSHPNPSQPNHFQSQQFQCQSWPIQSHQSLFPEIQSQQNHTQQTQSQQFQSVLVQKRPAVSSMLEEAGQVLRQVQRQKRVLEENLEALLRAKTGEVLHCQLEALAANRDWTEEVRVKKTVDAWINTLTKDIQDEMSSEDAVHHRAADTAVTSQQGACRGSAHPAKKRPMSMLRGIGSKTAAGRGSRAQTPGHRSVQGVDPDRATGVLTDREQVEGESYLTRLYGRAPYDGLRRTLKKSPYLRFSSPALALGRKSRPRLVESVRGVKVKSCKTQTCLAPPLNVSPVQHHHHTFSSTRMSSADIQSVPVAIPLGRPKIESSSRCCLSKHQQEVTSPPTAPPTVSVVALDDKAPEQQKVEQQDAGEAHPPSHTIDIMERRSGVEEEDTVFPGTDLLFVADIIQEEVSAVGEEAVELDGGSSPPPVMYQGPVFPPQALPALPEQNQAPILVLDQQKGALETQLVEWVEQQLMSRMISQMYQPPPPDPAQKISTDQSESEERSVTSDIVEAAGGGGVQLFVDSNIEVDSALIRQLVNEVLTETVTLMLGQRKALNTGPEPGPGPEAAQKDKLVPLVPTPVPTPSASPTPACRDATPLTTPPPSEPVSLFIEESQPITVPDPVATPTPSPEPTPSPGIPPVLHQASLSAAWEDAELPLEEERPEENLDTHKPPLLMSVAEEEPPHSSPHPPPSPSPPPPVLEPAPLSPTSSSEDSSSSNSSSNSSSSSTAVTAGTDAALKHISEGELLISVNQQAALTEEGAMCSFSSSLQELQDMDFDPPSEGQVKGHDHLLTKREQGHFNRGERLQPEGSWGREDEEEMSVGEVRDNRTTNSSKSMMAQQDHSSSPGQISLCADMSEVSFEGTNQGSVTMDNLMMEALDTLSSDLQIDLSLSLPPPHLENTHTAAQVVPILLQQNNPQADAQQKQQQGGGTRGMDVHLPSIRPEEEELMEESLSEAATTDSSTDDVF